MSGAAYRPQQHSRPIRQVVYSLAAGLAHDLDPTSRPLKEVLEIADRACPGPGSCALCGTANTTATTVTTDGGSVVLDGTVVTSEYIQADVGPFIALDSGALTANNVHLAGAAASYTMPVCETANIGQWVTVIVKDVSEVVVIEPLTGDTLHPAGVIIAVSEFMDSAGAATSDGDHVTFVCVTADNWYSTAIGGAWIDGGAS